MKNSQILLIAAVIVAVLLGTGYIGIGTFQTLVPGQPGPDVGVGTCPSDGDTTITLTLINGEDESAGTFDATGYFLDSAGNVAITVTDTTAGTATINCGEKYTFKLIAADGDQGDNSKVASLSGVSGGTAKVVDGGVELTASKGQMTMNMVGAKHAVIEARLFSNSNNAYFYDTGDAATTDYEVSGITFSSTTDNTTATAVGSGGQFETSLEYRSTRATTDFSDFGYWILLDADASDYDKPSCYLNGGLLTNAKGQMTEKESQQFSAYEFAYKADGKVIDDLSYLRCNWKALAGVDADADVKIGMAAIGNTLANNGVSIQRGATDDDSSATVSYAVQLYTIDVS